LPIIKLKRSFEMIVIIQKEDPKVKEILDVVRAESRFDYAMLFAGDRWYPVEWVALYLLNSIPVGVATLAPTDEMAQGDPHIIGGYVLKANRRQGIGGELLKVLVAKSLKEYSLPPTVDCTNLQAWNSACNIVNSGVDLNVNRFY
jgi:GNAT superfamily N-acetyltransferase